VDYVVKKGAIRQIKKIASPRLVIPIEFSLLQSKRHAVAANLVLQPIPSAYNSPSTRGEGQGEVVNPLNCTKYLISKRAEE
jgi:hypothetical protein